MWLILQKQKAIILFTNKQYSLILPCLTSLFPLSWLSLRTSLGIFWAMDRTVSCFFLRFRLFLWSANCFALVSACFLLAYFSSYPRDSDLLLPPTLLSFDSGLGLLNLSTNSLSSPSLMTPLLVLEAGLTPNSLVFPMIQKLWSVVSCVKQNSKVAPFIAYVLSDSEIRTISCYRHTFNDNICKTVARPPQNWPNYIQQEKSSTRLRNVSL